MVDRRRFTFAGLALALAGRAHAGGQAAPAAQQQSRGHDRAVEPLLRPRYTARRVGDEVHLELSLANLSDAPVEVLVERGTSPGPDVTAALEVGDEELQLTQAIDAKERRELMSRLAPIPRFAPIAPDKVLAAGTYRFHLPQGAVETEVVVRTSVLVMARGDSEVRVLPTLRVSWALQQRS